MESGTEQLIMADGLSSKPLKGGRAIGTSSAKPTLVPEAVALTPPGFNF
jgi:hypothetical protein